MLISSYFIEDSQKYNFILHSDKEVHAKDW